MKKLINDPNNVVAEALRGIEGAHPELQVDHHHKIIYRGGAPRRDKVGIISGGGSGHEPLHGGFVGMGMLDAACAGEMFTSPVPEQMLAATKLVNGGAGVLHVVKNYTGDVMNFEMAAELAAAETGARVVSVVTDDDVAVQDSTWTAGRRGVGVTVLLEKIAGAAAEQGRDLDQVAEVARTVNANGRSMGVALTSCTVPAAGKPTFDLGEGEMELGVGIHGEPGRRAVATGARERDRIAPARADSRGPALRPGRTGHRVRQRARRHAVDRALRDVQQGPEDPGRARRADRAVARRVLHHVPGHGRDLDHPAQGRRRAALPLGRSRQHSRTEMGHLTMSENVSAAALELWVRSFARLVAESRDQLTELDAAIGDADHGSNMDRGMQAAVAALDESPQVTAGPLLTKVGMTLVSTVGGASGPLFGTLFLRMGSSLGSAETNSAGDLAAALRAGLGGVVDRGKAGPGDKTMYDALAPAVDALERALDERAPLATGLKAAREAAAAGRDATTPMLARKGRASYLGERSVGHQDPGATTVALLIEAAAETPFDHPGSNPTSQ